MSFQALIASCEEALVQRFSVALGEVGIKVDSVGHTGRALSMLSDQQYEAVVVDCDLEGGVDLIEIVRHETRNQRSIVLAFATGQDIARSASQFGANFVLAKPINWEVARRTLRAAHSLIIRERRRCIREKVRVPAKLVLAEGELEVTITDLSTGGLALATPVDLSSCTQVDLRFTLPGTNRPVHCCGTLAWRKGDSVGVEFSYLTPACEQTLHVWLDRHSPRRSQRSAPK